MKTFIYYSKFDSTKEPIGKIYAFNLECAQIIGAYKKQMPIDSFLKVFAVEEI